MISPIGQGLLDTDLEENTSQVVQYIMVRSRRSHEKMSKAVILLFPLGLHK